MATLMSSHLHHEHHTFTALRHHTFLASSAMTSQFHGTLPSHFLGQRALLCGGLDHLLLHRQPLAPPHRVDEAAGQVGHPGRCLFTPLLALLLREGREEGVHLDGAGQGGREGGWVGVGADDWAHEPGCPGKVVQASRDHRVV